MKNNLVLSVIFLTTLILCFIFSIVSFVKISDSDHIYISSLGNNWSLGPISEVVAGGFECPPGKVSIINDEWSGTNRGCFCSGIFNTLTASTCSRKNRYYCQDVMEIAPIKLSQWRSTNFCGKRGSNYLKLKTASSPNGCGSGYKSCGIIDTLKNYLCYPTNIDCPINYMDIQQKDYVVPTDKTYNTIPLGNNGIEGKAIFSNQFVDKNLITYFKIDDDQPCLSPEYKNLKHNSYILEKTYGYDKCTNEIGGEFFDKSYQKLDTISYNQLYSNNGIMNILNILPLFSSKYNYVQSTTSLFHKNYIGLDKKCLQNQLKNESEEEFINGLINIEDQITSAKIAALVGMILAIVGITLTIGILIMGICCSCDSWSGFLIFFSIIIICLPALICGSIIVGKINSQNTDLSEIAQPGCTDNITSLALNNFTSKIYSAKSMAAAYLSFGIIGIISGIMLAIFS